MTVIELPLFRSELQAHLLGLILRDPARTWTTSELKERLGATAVSIHRELQRSLRAGIVTREGIGRAYLYRAATTSPLYEPLRVLLDRTVGVEVELRRLLEGLPGVHAAFIHGSFAAGAKFRPSSDVDVLVLGDVDYRVLRTRLRELERRMGREIDVVAYGLEEFASLVREGNSFARSIVDGEVKPLVGDVSDLSADHDARRG